MYAHVFTSTFLIFLGEKDILTNSNPNRELELSKTDNAGHFAFRFAINHVTICINKVKTQNHDSVPVKVRAYYEMCDSPLRFVDCLTNRHKSNVSIETLKANTLLFCTVRLPDKSSVSVDINDCSLYEDRETSESCVRTLDVAPFAKLPMKKMKDKECEVSAEYGKCIADRATKECPEKQMADVFFEYELSWLGGRCLAAQNIRNDYVTMEITDSAWVNQPTLLGLIVAATVAVFVYRL